MEKLSGRTVELILYAAMGNPLSTARYEGHCAGDSLAEVTGIAVCYAPTVEVLRRAGSENKNLIIAREHPFYLHGGVNYSYTTDGLDAMMKDDPVAEAKRKLIAEHHLTVYRYGAAWDQFRPEGQSAALARAMGFKPGTPTAGDRSRAVVCDLVGETPVITLAKTATDRLHCRTPRLVGDMHMRVSRVAVIAGETDPKESLAKVLLDGTIDGLVCGAGGTIDEVDGAIAYFRDLIATGRKIVMLAVGYGPSQDPGVGEMAAFIQRTLPDLSVDWWPASDPRWIP